MTCHTDDSLRAAEDLQSQMQAIRSHLPDDVNRIVEGAKRLVDWRQIVGRHPVAAAAAAAVVGNWITPSKPQVIRPDLETLAKLVRKQPELLRGGASAAPRPGVLATLAGMAIPLLTRAGVNYATQQFQRAGAQPRPSDPLTQSPS